jgi:hypothetical protein
MAKPVVVHIVKYLFRLEEGSLSSDRVKVEFQPDVQELVLTLLCDETVSLALESDAPLAELQLGQIEIRLALDVARDLVDRLPPEVLH